MCWCSHQVLEVPGLLWKACQPRKECRRVHRRIFCIMQGIGSTARACPCSPHRVAILQHHCIKACALAGIMCQVRAGASRALFGRSIDRLGSIPPHLFQAKSHHMLPARAHRTGTSTLCKGCLWRSMGWRRFRSLLSACACCLAPHLNTSSRQCCSCWALATTGWVPLILVLRAG